MKWLDNWMDDMSDILSPQLATAGGKKYRKRIAKESNMTTMKKASSNHGSSYYRRERDEEAIAQELLQKFIKMNAGELAYEMVGERSYQRDVATAVYKAKYKGESVDAELTETILRLTAENEQLKKATRLIEIKNNLNKIPKWIQWFFI